MVTYKQIMTQVAHLGRFGVETGAIGCSVDGRAIPYVFVGSKCGRQVLITAGIHAREHVGSELVMRQIYYVLNRQASYEGGIYFLPMLNPDGNAICEKGASAIRRRGQRLLVERLLNGKDARLYKANANGVDLNVNFDADWGKGEQNVRVPMMANYIGTAPFSEPETIALRDFTRQVMPVATVSYHAIGREIYWEYGQTGGRRSRDLSLAGYLNERLQYAVKGDLGASTGGYKDYCIQTLGISAFTIELVDEKFVHPFCNYSLADEDFERNLDLPIRLLNALGYMHATSDKK